MNQEKPTIDIPQFFNVVDILNNCGIDNFSIRVDEEQNRVTGVSNDLSYCVSNYLENPITDYHIGISNSKVLHQRMKLFNQEKVNAQLEVHEQEAKQITFQEEERVTSFRFTNVDNIRSIKTISSGPNISGLTFDQDHLKFIRNAIQSMRVPEKICFMGFQNDIWVVIKDEYNDTFKDVIGKNEVEKNWTIYWKTNSFLTLIQKAVQYEEDQVALLVITENGFGFINISDLKFILLPQEE